MLTAELNVHVRNKHMGSSLNFSPFGGHFNKGAVLYWRLKILKEGPEFRELQVCYGCSYIAPNYLLIGCGSSVGL